MVDELKFSKILIGTLGSIAAIGSALGAIFFNLIAKKLNFRTLLIFSILISGLGTFFSLIYLLSYVKNNYYLAIGLQFSKGLY